MLTRLTTWSFTGVFLKGVPSRILPSEAIVSAHVPCVQQRRHHPQALQAYAERRAKETQGREADGDNTGVRLPTANNQKLQKQQHPKPASRPPAVGIPRSIPRSVPCESLTCYARPYPPKPLPLHRMVISCHLCPRAPVHILRTSPLAAEGYRRLFAPTPSGPVP
eukprot:5322342-Pyramimonas_sp.AAC.1